MYKLLLLECLFIILLLLLFSKFCFSINTEKIQTLVR